MSSTLSNLSKTLWECITANPTKTYWVSRTAIYSYGDLASAIATRVAVFNDKEIAQGRVIVIATTDEWAAVTWWLAALLNGQVPTILAADSGDARLAGIVNLTNPGLVVTDADRVRADWVSSREAIVATLDGDATGPSAEPSLNMPSDGLAYILFTSGTTAEPKGAMLSHKNLHAQLETISRVLEVNSSSRIFNGLVLYHVDGIVQGPVLAAFNGGSLLRPEIFALNRLESDLCWLRDQGATHLISVPTIYAMIDRYAAEDTYFDRPEFRVLLTTSAPIDEALWRRIEARFGKPVVNEYGMTETVAATHFAGSHPEMGRSFTIGKPIGCSARLCDPQTGELAAQGEVGELQVRGDNIFMGYFERPKETAAVFTDDGWFRTGDLCQVGDDDSYVVAGRMSTVINTGGFLVRPEEIDEGLRGHPDVLEAQTIGMPHPDFGAIPVSAVVLKKDVSSAAIIEHCREKLEWQKVPKRIVPLETIPRRGSGKADLTALRELLEQSSKRESETNKPHTEAVVQLLSLAAETFGCESSELSLDMQPDEINGWDSYSHMVLVMELEQAFGVRFTTEEISSINSLGDFALKIDTVATVSAAGRSRAVDADVPKIEIIREGTDGLNLICLPDIFAVPFSTNQILGELDARHSLLALHPSAGMGSESGTATVQQFAQQFADVIEEYTKQDSKEIVLVGYSFGGFLSHEVAAELTARGQAPLNTLLIDTTVPLRLRQETLLGKAEWCARHVRWRSRQVVSALRMSDVAQLDLLDAPGVFPIRLGDHPAILRPIIRQFFRSLLIYTPSKSTTATTVFRATGRKKLLELPRALGWDSWVDGPIDVIDLPGTHYTILFGEGGRNDLAISVNDVLSRLG